jgi:hypothetical protein
LRFLALSVTAIAISVWVLVWVFADGGEKRNARWAVYKSAHHCKLVEAWTGDAGTTDEHKKTVYLCDDGVKYWR